MLLLPPLDSAKHYHGVSKSLAWIWLRGGWVDVLVGEGDSAEEGAHG